MEKRFNKKDRILFEGDEHECICEDDEIAVFAPAFENNVKYENMFVVSNKDIDDNFSFERV